MHFLTNSPEVLFGLLDRAYRTVRPDGGVVITNTPKPGVLEALKKIDQELGIPPRPGIQGVTVEDIVSWAEMINSSNIGLHVDYFHSDSLIELDSMMIKRSEGSPSRLPTMADLQMMMKKSK